MSLRQPVQRLTGAFRHWIYPENAVEVQVDWLITGGDYTITAQEISAFGCAGTASEALWLVAQPEPDWVRMQAFARVRT